MWNRASVLLCAVGLCACGPGGAPGSWPDAGNAAAPADAADLGAGGADADAGGADSGAARDLAGPPADLAPPTEDLAGGSSCGPCDHPPAAVCYEPTGVCAAGTCSYAYDDGARCDDGDPCTEDDACATGVCRGRPISCTAPPADRCDDAHTLRVYDRVGVCGAGSCSYPYHFVTCTAGCAAGRCQATPWTALQSGVSVPLHGVWGASAGDVFATGTNGTIIHWNGAQWKTMAVPQGTGDLRDIDGTASSNVFAITTGQSLAGYKATVLRWDGGAWKARGQVPCYGFCCVGAIGPDDAYTWSDDGQLNRVHGGRTDLVTSISMPDTLFHDCDVRVLAADDVYIGGGYVYHYDGAKLTEVVPPVGGHQGAGGLAAFGPTELLAFAWDKLGRWDGSAWLSVPTGGDGAVNGLGGTSFTRVFAAGGDGTGGAIAFWDGTGWSGEPLPAATPDLNGVWAAPTGEVFAVGDKGTILEAVH